MNYRHAFHAGNHADVLKHVCLSLVIDHLKHKAAPFAVMDTHAGRGAYALDGQEAQRSPEWRGGVGRIWDWANAPAAMAPFLDALRGANPDGELHAYPGSPLIALAGMREQDRLIACELHPEEAGVLRRRLSDDPRAQVHQRNGFEAMGALLPFTERRGLVLIDPPYEDRDHETIQTIRALRAALDRFGHGVYMWWRPVKDVRETDMADQELFHGRTLKTLRVDLAVDRVDPEGRLVASSVLIVNPPYTLAPALAELMPALSERLAATPAAGWRMETMGG
ncbi:MAG: 23S rRNA (adenine(2030)-N(6))-methyltransferase RlmJ [Hyphomonadaceae bacterium]|nr:23S rRNA (adenine(2030)-N(6))-methyltransferase RlmJ [Hyphomonadaceae bacterium]